MGLEFVVVSSSGVVWASVAGSVGASVVDLVWGVPSVDGGWVMRGFVGWANGVSGVVSSSSVLLVLGFVVSEGPLPAECFVSRLILPVLMIVVVSYSSVRGVLMDADPSSEPSPLDPPF